MVKVGTGLVLTEARGEVEGIGKLCVCANEKFGAQSMLVETEYVAAGIRRSVVSSCWLGIALFTGAEVDGERGSDDPAKDRHSCAIGLR